MNYLLHESHRKPQSTVANVINHIVFVLDESDSMRHHTQAVVKVADNQIAHLAERSKELDQETRITVYTFNNANNIRCLIWDKDVLRMPSIENLYRPNGLTALLDATGLMIEDLRMTPEKYGEHAFLAYVLTDGMENRSVQYSVKRLTEAIQRLPDNWTLAAFVPNAMAMHETKKLGFPSNNVAIWDVTSRQGITEVGAKMREATESFMQGRAKGVRSSNTLFTAAVDPTTIKRTLTPVTSNSYYFLDVDIVDPTIPPNSKIKAPKGKIRVDEFMRTKTGSFNIGDAFYELTKSEKVQGTKDVAILLKSDNTLYMGKNARQMLGLPTTDTQVRPGDHADYTVFIRSTSPNRHLIEGTRVLLMR